MLSGVLILSFENLKTHFRQNFADLWTSASAAAASVNTRLKSWKKVRHNHVSPEQNPSVADNNNLVHGECAVITSSNIV